MKITGNNGSSHFDIVMVKAWIALSTIVIILYVLALRHVHLDASFIALSIFFQVASSALVIFLIRHIRGTIVVDKEPPYGESQLRLGGYVWRAVLVQYVSSQLVAFLFLIFFGRAQPSFLTLIVGFVLGAVVSVVMIWAFFSKDRIGQLRWLASFGRGF